MLGALLILSFAIFLAFFEPVLAIKKSSNKENTKYDAEIKKLWTIAKDSMNSRKTLRAEKALLTILKLDETNAIEFFEIAQSLDNNPMSLHNVGLIYLETGSYEKASMAFQQALKLDSTVAARFLALAKAEEKLGHKKAAIEALESAYNLDKSTTTLRQILSIYEEAGDQENIDITTARIEQQIAEDALKKAELEKTKKKEKKVKEPARVRPRPQPKIIYPRASAPINAIKKAAISSIHKNRSAQESTKNKTVTATNEINNTTLRQKKLSTTTSNNHHSNNRPRVIQ